MLQGLLSFVFAISSIFLILLVLIQKGKSSMGLGQMGGGTQMLFGSSGGQDIMQKTTWVLGAILIFGSLGLALLKARQARSINIPTMEQTMPALPTDE